MSRKDYILKRIEELERERKTREKLEKKERAYDPAEMDCEKMPLGCWFWVILIPILVVVLAGKLF